MSKIKVVYQDIEESLMNKGFQEWEMEKMIQTMSISEIKELIKKISKEISKRQLDEDNSN